MKKILSLILASLMLFSAFNITVLADDAVEPMPEITDFSNYDNIVSSGTCSATDGAKILAEGVKGDYVITGDLNSGTAADDWGYVAVAAGLDVFKVLLKSTQIFYAKSDKNIFIYKDGNVNVDSTRDTDNKSVMTWTVSDEAWYSQNYLEFNKVYNIYMSRVGTELIFGMRLDVADGQTENEWNYYTIETENTDIAQNIGLRVFCSTGANFENVNIYTPKAPMPEITDFSNYDNIVSSGNCSATDGAKILAEGVKGDYVITGDLNSGTDANDWGYVAVAAGLDVFKVMPKFTRIFYAKSDKNIFIYKDGNVNVDSSRDTDNKLVMNYDVYDKAWYSQNYLEFNKVYNIYMSRVGTELIFGMRLDVADGQTENEWNYYTIETENTDIAQNIGLRVFCSTGANFENVNIYTPFDLVADVSYTTDASAVKATLTLDRVTSAGAEDAVFVTAIYVVAANGDTMMSDIDSADINDINVGDTYISEEPNVVEIPTLKEGETYYVRSFLWKSYDDITPLVPAFDKAN